MKTFHLFAILCILIIQNVSAQTFHSLDLVAPEFREVAPKLHANIRSQDDLIPFQQKMAGQLPLPPAVEAPEKVVASGTNNVDLYVYRPDNIQANSPVIYFIHGGGHVFGSATQNNAALYELANQTGAVVISAEYRLAIDAPFPAAINDLYQGLTYVYSNSQVLDIDTDRLIVMGESAGGGLAASLAIMTRDRGEFKLAGQVLIYPMLDYRTGSKQSLYNNPYAGEFMWTSISNNYGWDTLHSNQAISIEDMPYFSAATATNLIGLPHTFIMVGSLDLFVNESIDYANRLIQAGVPTDLIVYTGVFHAFELVKPDSPQAIDYKKRRNIAIQAMFNNTTNYKHSVIDGKRIDSERME